MSLLSEMLSCLPFQNKKFSTVHITFSNLRKLRILMLLTVENNIFEKVRERDSRKYFFYRVKLFDVGKERKKKTFPKHHLHLKIIICLHFPMTFFSNLCGALRELLNVVQCCIMQQLKDSYNIMTVPYGQFVSR